MKSLRTSVARRPLAWPLLLSVLLWVFAALSVAAAVTGSERKNVKVVLETTAGDITIRLYDDTPVHRDNFIRLVEQGFYDSLLIHRVIEDFMIQTGDPASRHAAPGEKLGEGGPGYTLPAEINLPYNYHRRGAVAAAREPDDVNPEWRSSGSQFYIVWGKSCYGSEMKRVRSYVYERTGGLAEFTPAMLADYSSLGGAPHLDGQYTVFGEVCAGLKVVGKIQKVATDANDRPRRDVRILRAYIKEK